MRPVVNTRVLYTFLSALIILTGSLVVIRFAQGYRFSQQGTIKGEGLLVANSFPSGAEIYINDKLVGATDNTIYLEPNEYQVDIKKDGYMPWSKKLRLENELVTQTNAQLFRRVPSLTPLTFSGVKNISPSPDGQKLLYYVSSASAQIKNGLYVLELSDSFFTNKEPYQIAEESPGFDFTKANFIWSPDSTQVVLSVPGHDVLLDPTKMNVLSTMSDIGLKKKETLSEWESEAYIRERQYLGRFPNEIIQVATESAKNVYLSPDKKKIFYVATASATIPHNLAPALPSSDNQPESRTIQPGNFYVYDREEDKNFEVSLPTSILQPLPSPSPSPTPKSLSALKNAPEPSPSPITNGVVTGVEKVLLASDLFDKTGMSYTSSPSSFTRLQASASAQSSVLTAEKFQSYYSSLYSLGVQWFPDSKHLIFTDQDKIYIIEYDNTNKTPVYEGPYEDNFVYPWPDGSKLLISTSFSANLQANLYAVELK